MNHNAMLLEFAFNPKVERNNLRVSPALYVVKYSVNLLTLINDDELLHSHRYITRHRAVTLPYRFASYGVPHTGTHETVKPQHYPHHGGPEGIMLFEIYSDATVIFATAPHALPFAKRS